MIKIDINKTKLKSAVFCVLSVLLLLSLIVNLLQCYSLTEPKETSTETDTVVIRDTIKAVLPLAKDSIVIKTEITRLKIVPEEKYIHDTLHIHTKDTIYQKADSALVEIPITQKTYESKDYKAWVSGYHPRLDSISVYKDTKVITNTITIKPKPKPWGLGIHLGYGYDGKEFKPYIGVGVSYDVWRF